jgi:hypothetical protein
MRCLHTHNVLWMTKSIKENYTEKNSHKRSFGQF